MARYSGRNGMIYLGVGSVTQVGQLKDWSISRETDRVDTTCMTDANKTYVQGLPDMQGSFSAFWDAADDALFTAAESSTAPNMYIYPSSSVTSKYWYGTAFVDADIKGAVNGAIEMSASWAAASSWGRK